jgi:hypothetical protein
MSTITHFSMSSESFRAGRFKRIRRELRAGTGSNLCSLAGRYNLAGSAERAKLPKVAKGGSSVVKLDILLAFSTQRL